MALLHPREDLANRVPVWSSMTAFFLDTDLRREDILYIAKVCAASPYSAKELERIMFSEVWPAFLPNLFATAGEWSGWSEDFVRERVMKKYKRRIYFSWRLNPLKRYFCKAYTVVEKEVDVSRRKGRPLGS
ncbi:DUF7079 family protein [Herbaspirillum sp. CF444]|uniref:DUF7079 family protein n=1 Tax=Herbaspirillum sp. CF444 TaxID=1144319 RepID=UPI0012FBE00A|nr:hypothetical protein [Herbaspirillum sp. CF444]